MSADADGHEDLRLDGSVTIVGIVGLLGLVGSRIAQLVVVRGQGIQRLLGAFHHPDRLASPLNTDELAWFQLTDIHFYRSTCRFGFGTRVP